MGDTRKTKAQLIEELKELRCEAKRLKASQCRCNSPGGHHKESEEKYRVLVEGSPQGNIIVQGPPLRVVFANPAIERIFGYSVKELQNLPAEAIWKLIHEEDRDHTIKAFENRLTGKPAPQQYELRAFRKDGKISWVNVRSSRIQYEGKPALQALMSDITEQKRNAQMQSVLHGIANAVNTSESLDELFRLIRDQLATILDTSNFCIALYDKEEDLISPFYFIDENDQPKAFPAGKTLTSYVIKRSEPLFATAETVRKLTRAGEVKPMGTPSKVWLGVPLKRGNEAIGAVVVQSYKDSSAYTEKDLEILAFVSDQIAFAIERQRAYDALRRGEERFRDLFENANDLIQSVDIDGRFLYVNRKWLEILGYSREDLKRLTFQDVVRPDHISHCMEILQRVAKGEPVDKMEAVFVTKDGRDIHVEGSVNANLQKGRFTATRGIFRDVTERRRAEMIQSALYRISEITNSAEDMQEFYSEVHAVVGELMYAQNFYIVLYDASRQILDFPYFVDEHDPNPQSKKLGRGLTEYVIRTGRPLLTSHEAFDEMVERGEVELIGSPSIDWLGVPLKRGTETFGVLVVQSYTEDVRFGEDDKELLMFVGRHIAVALERKRAEKALRQSEEKYRTIFELSPEAIAILDTKGTVLDINGRLYNWLGYPTDHWIGKNLIELSFMTEESRVKAMGMFIQHIFGREVGPYELEFAAKDGEKHVGVVVGSPIKDKEGKIAGVIAMVMDVTSQKRLETKYAAIHDFSKKVTTLLEMDDILSITIDLISRVLGHKYCAILLLDSEKRELSQTAYRGYSKKQMDNLKLSIRGKGVTTWVAREGKPVIVADVGEDKRYVRVFDDVKSEAAVPIKLGDEVIGVINVESIQSDAFSEGDLTLLSALASYLAVSIKNSRLFRDLGHAKDELEQWGLQLECKVRERTDELRSTQEQLLRSERLATIGQLAASVGHELRNPLGVLHNSLYLLDSKLKNSDEKVRRQLETMKREVSRSNTIISDLLNFSRSGKPALAPTDLRATVEEALSKVSVPDGIDVLTNLASLPQISADRIQLESVVINLVSNGIQAMPDGGTLKVETSENGDHVELKISDTGVGISEESLDKIFEPLYTTKSKGIGLGLCVTKRFIENHGGTIDVESAPNQGTTFHVRLPLERQREERLAAASKR